MHPTKINVKIKLLSANAFIPQYATEGSAGFDLVAIHDIGIQPGETRLVKTGLAMEIPLGWELQIRPRSGLSLKTGLRVANSPGTVDSDYRGEICVIMTNIASESGTNFEEGSENMGYDVNTEFIHLGDRIAQAVLCPVGQANFSCEVSLGDTQRGSGGFGSTGV